MSRSDLADLARETPLPYSVLVTGGAFVETPQPNGEQTGEQWTFHRVLSEGASDDRPAEAFALDDVARTLREGRVFVRVELDDSPPEFRRTLANQTQPFGTEQPELLHFLADARDEGHDLLLVIEKVQDGPIQYRGVNGQWPITALTWLLVGLGVLIPDHSYESQASLHVALRDVVTGDTLDERILTGGPANLSLVQRTGFVGLLESIIVPPFWVGDTQADVQESIRGIASARLVVSLAHQLKSIDAQARLASQLPAKLTVTRENGVVRLTVTSRAALSEIALRVDGTPLPPEEIAAVRTALLQSGEVADDTWHYAVDLPPRARGERLQILVQTVAGRATSMTIEMPR